MGRPDRRMRLLGLSAMGVAVFRIGVIVALRQLPEWRNLSLPEESFFAARLQQVAGPADLRLESLPHVQLRSKGFLTESDLLSERETAYDILGPAAADWLTRPARRPYVAASAP